MRKKILVTGGCGYIGSHTVRQLSDAGHEVFVVDNLSTGFKDALINNEQLIEMDLEDTSALKKVLASQDFDSVIHFAAAMVVSESVEKPYKYYSNNTSNTLELVKAAVDSGVKNFVFSSTAALYGGGAAKVSEMDKLAPESPYGWSKLMSEQIIKDICAKSNMKYAILRYFNVAGADFKKRMGQRTKNATHLIKVLSETLVGKRPKISIFGTDYSTKDGTGVRDYIHVEDLAAAHIESLSYLNAGNASEIFNVGYGEGFSVNEVIASGQALFPNTKIVVETCNRRAGDVDIVVADNAKILKSTSWLPKYNDLSAIVKSAVEWEQIQK